MSPFEHFEPSDEVRDWENEEIASEYELDGVDWGEIASKMIPVSEIPPPGPDDYEKLPDGSVRFYCEGGRWIDFPTLDA